MPTKTKTKTKPKKKPNTNLKFTVAVDWQGEYFDNCDALHNLFPKHDMGSGVGIHGNDYTFSEIPSKDLIRLIATVREFCKKRERSALNEFYNWGITIYLA
jgi:hypothetical protein